LATHEVNESDPQSATASLIAAARLPDFAGTRTGDGTPNQCVVA
jgi:hypothetical protein